MKKRICLFLLALALCLTACQTEPPAVSSDPTTVPTQTTAAPTQTTVPPETTAPMETTEPEVLLFPKGEIQAVLLYFADVLYVQDGQILSGLPEEYVYAGTVFEGKPDEIPTRPGVGCHIPAGAEFYGSPVNPDYLLVACEDGYWKMTRAGLMDTGWSKDTIDTAVPENYTQAFFTDLFTTRGVTENYYNLASPMAFDSTRSLNLKELFSNGFEILNQRYVPLTEEETAFLLANGYGENMPLSNAERIPEANMDAVLQRFFGIKLSETKGVGLQEIGVYHEPSKCYYSWVSGLNWSFITVEDVQYEESTGTGVVILNCDVGYELQMKMTLQREENVLRIVSNKSVNG